jgi:type VI secretion system protein ImpE
VEALAAVRAGKPVDAAKLLEESEAARKPVGGSAGGVKFSAFRDGDDLLAPFLEVLAPGGRYVWLPLEMVQSLELTAPSKLRDLLWAPAKIRLRSGPSGDGYIPVVYPGSWEHADEAIRLGRRTDWVGDGPVRGAGQRVFYLDGNDRGLLELRSVEFSAG